MKLSRPVKIIIAVMTLWPALYMFIFMAIIFSTVLMGPHHGTPQHGFFPFQLLFGLHFLTMLEIVAMIAFYVTFIFKTDRIAEDKKALWAVVIFLGNMFAMPVFWYLYIWPEPLEFVFTEES